MTELIAITKMDIASLPEDWSEDMQASVNFRWVRTPEEALPHLPEAEALLISSNIKPEWLDRADKLKWIHSLSAGVDKLPLAYFAERGITLTNSSGVHTVQMSEYALGMMLQWVRRSAYYTRMQQQKTWSGGPSTDELYNKTVGILGPGQIGQAIAPKAKAFGMKVVGYSRSGKLLEGFDEIRSGAEGLDQVLEESDFVISILPGTEETRHLISMKQLKRMKPTAFLINMGRGIVIKESDLISALQNGIIAGAGLDVFEREPLPEDSPLWALDNVILTPHISGNSPKYVKRASVIFNDNLRRFLTGRELRNVVDTKSGY